MIAAMMIMITCSGMMVVAMFASCDASIVDEVYVTWAGDHVNISATDETIYIKLDYSSGSEFASKNKYLHGSISMDIKLKAGDSAGTVTCFFLSTETSNQDEVDFEFLGNITGQPYILQTNIYANGTFGREQRIYLWFDPAADYHNYTVFWNSHHVILFVDSVPIRVFSNNKAVGVPYLMGPMRMLSSIWNGDSWATRGGREKINWNSAPFIASYKNYKANACVWSDIDPAPSCASQSANNWWEQSPYQYLSADQARQLSVVKRNYTIYDYCTDRGRYPTPPAECDRES